MADTIERIYKITADASQAVRELEKLNKSVGGIDAKLGKTGEILKNALSGAAIVAGIKKTVDALLQTSEAMDEISKSAAKFGIATENLIAFKEAADFSGVDFQSLQTGLKKLSVAMADIAAGGKSDAGEAITQLGISVQNASGALRETGAVFSDVAEAFSQIPAGAEKAALAVKIFGKAGADLIPLLDEGAAGLEEFRRQAEALGLIFDDPAGKMAERFNDNLAALGKTSEGITTQFMTGLLPALTELTDSFSKGNENISAFREIGEGVGAALLIINDALTLLARLVDDLAAPLNAVVKSIIDLVSNIVALTPENIPRQIAANFKTAFNDMDEAAQAAIASIGKLFHDIKTEPSDLALEIRKNFSAENLAPPTPLKLTDFISDLKADGLKGINDELKKMDDAEKAAQKAAEDLKQSFIDLADKADPLAAALRDADEAQKTLNAAMAAGIGTAEQYAKIQDLITRQRFDAADFADPFEKQKEAAKALVDQLDPLNAQAKELKRQFDLLTEAQVFDPENAELYADALGEVSEKLFELGDTAEESGKVLDEIGVAMGQTLSSGISSFVDTLTSTSGSFKQWAADMVVSIAKVIAQLMILKAIKSSAGLSSFLGLANGAAFSNFGFPWGIYTEPMAFPMAGAGTRYFANGGVGVFAEAGPEAIMPLSRDPGSGRLGVDSVAPVVNVNVHNNTDAQVSARRNGSDIELVINRVSQDILRGGGKISKAIEQTYNLGR